MMMLEEFGPEIFGDSWEMLREEITPVSCHEVARWFYAANSQEHWEFERDFPNVAPPFPVAWYEYRHPLVSNNEGEILDLAEMLGLPSSASMDVGILMHTSELPESMRENPPREPIHATNFLERFPKMQELREDPRWFAEDPGRPVRWSAMAQIFPRLSIEEDVPSVDALAFFYIGADGRIVGAPRLVPSPQAATTGIPPTPSPGGLLFPVLFAISLMHCKNVEVHDDKVPEKVRRNRIKKGKEPGLDTKTIVVKGLQEQVRAALQHGESEIDRALHMVRGHWRTYTEEKPLFGKIAGRFFIPMHTRGSSEEGEVDKDYRVEP